MRLIYNGLSDEIPEPYRSEFVLQIKSLRGRATAISGCYNRPEDCARALRSALRAENATLVDSTTLSVRESKNGHAYEIYIRIERSLPGICTGSIVRLALDGQTVKVSDAGGSR